MRYIFISFRNGYQLFFKNRIAGLPVEKCRIENLKSLQQNGCWLRSTSSPVAELHYFKFFQYKDSDFPGVSIIRALGKNMEINQDCSYFLADFMTVDGLKIAGLAHISEIETKILAEEILKTFDYFGFHVVGHGQMVTWFSGKYPYINWKLPYQLINQNYREYLPQDGTFRTLVRIVENSCRLLEKHPVNRVRVDLGENPANFLWFHSQNRTVKKIPLLSERTRKETIFWSNNSRLNDIASFLGFKIAENKSISADSSIIWFDIEPETSDLIGTMHACEFIDSEIISGIDSGSDRIVIEFNSGFSGNTRNVLYFLYPAKDVNFLKKVQYLRKSPGAFLIENG